MICLYSMLVVALLIATDFAVFVPEANRLLPLVIRGSALGREQK